MPVLPRNSAGGEVFCRMRIVAVARVVAAAGKLFGRSGTTHIICLVTRAKLPNVSM